MQCGTGRSKLWGVALCLWIGVFLAEPASAQAFRHPFAVGAQEGAIGPVSGLSAWIIGQESTFYQLLAKALDSARYSRFALLGLLGLGFGYGVFHAAGPGHGKAVITAYMVSNERALKRGIVISGLAAFLQALVAIVLIGVAALVFNATAQKMTAAAHLLELAAYCGIVLLGLALVWHKGETLIATLRLILAEQAARWSLNAQLAAEPALLRIFTSPPEPYDAAPRASFRAIEASNEAQQASPPDESCGSDCGHMIDPRRFSDGFSWKSAAITVLTAGARPCSGAILVLVFSLARNIFLIGIAAVLAMAVGTALTTAGLATMAVFGKKLAVRIVGGQRSRTALLMGQIIEVGAALCVLLFGMALLAASWSGMLVAA